MADLTTLARVKRQLAITNYETGILSVNTVDDDLITLFVSEASKMFETDAKMSFSAAPGTLTFDLAAPYTYGRKLFFRTPVVSVYSLTTGDGTVIPSTGYRLLPLNLSPSFALELLGNYTWDVSSTNGVRGAITVAGTLGYCTAANVPADVTTAVTKLAAFLYQNRNNNESVIRLADGSMEIPAKAPDLILRVLRNYAKVQVYA